MLRRDGEDAAQVLAAADGLVLTRVVSGPTYLAPWRTGEIVVGATEEDAGFACHVTPTGLMHLGATVAKLAPRLREARFGRAWAGLRSVTPGGNPLIGRYPGTKAVLIASGHAGQGILTSALTGRAVAELIEHGRSEVAAAFEPKLYPETRLKDTTLSVSSGKSSSRESRQSCCRNRGSGGEGLQRAHQDEVVVGHGERGP